MNGNEDCVLLGCALVSIANIVLYITNLPRQERYYHSAARLGDSILVMGGTTSSTTAEMVPGALVISVVCSYSSLLTGGGEYSLQHESAYACAIGLEDAQEVVLIGGGSGSTIHGHVSR